MKCRGNHFGWSFLSLQLLSIDQQATARAQSTGLCLFGVRQLVKRGQSTKTKSSKKSASRQPPVRGAGHHTYLWQALRFEGFAKRTIDQSISRLICHDMARHSFSVNDLDMFATMTPSEAKSPAIALHLPNDSTCRGSNVDVALISRG